MAKLCALCKGEASCRLVLSSGETVLACKKCADSVTAGAATHNGGASSGLCHVCHLRPIVMLFAFVSNCCPFRCYAFFFFFFLT